MLKRISIFIITFVLLFAVAGCNFNGNSDKEKFTVTFDCEIECELGSVEVTEGGLVSVPKTPVHEGYVFLGWFNGETKWNFEKDTVSENITLTAKWEEEAPLYNPADIFEANDPEKVMALYQTVLTESKLYADLEKASLLEHSKEYLALNDSEYAYKALGFDAEGNVVLNALYDNHLIYQVNGEVYSIEFVNENANLLGRYLPNCPADATIGEVVEEANPYFEVEYKYLYRTGAIARQYANVTTRYYFDAETLAFERIEETRKMEEEVLSFEVITFEYAAKEIELTLDPKEAHETAEDAIELTIVLNLGEENEEKLVYTVSNESKVSNTDPAYRLYKNMDLTKDVLDLSYIYEYAFIYYASLQPEFSFNFVLTEEDHAEFTEIVTQLQEAIIANEERPLVETLMEKFNDKFEFIEAHYIIGQVNYYKNLKSSSNEAKYELAKDTYYAIFEEYKAFCRAVYESESIYREEFFEGWTEEDFEAIYVDEVATEIRQQMTDLEDQANNLDYTSAKFHEAATAIYERYIKLSKEYADYYNYDNYYEYASENVYSRDYSSEDLANFHQYVKDYIVPLTKKVMAEASRDYSYLTSNQKYAIDNLLERPYNRIGVNYMDDYINSFDNNLSKYFNSLFDKGSVFFVNDSRAYDGAFVNYLSYYEEGFAYFGPSYQTTYTIIHEMGHYAATYSYNFGGLNYDLAETHSQANEWLFSYYLKEKLDPETHAVLVKQNLANALQTVVISAAIDEFEQTVYSGDYNQLQFDDVMKQIHTEYDMEDIYSWSNMKIYWKLVAIGSPVYYISYATSQIASINLYMQAEMHDYEYAQEVYRKLQEEGSSEQGFVEVILNSGLSNPFTEQIYKDMLEVFTDSEE